MLESMTSLITLVVLGLGFAYFATQNAGFVSITLANNLFTIPVYTLALGSLLIGLLISGFIHLVSYISSLFDLHNKDVQINQSQKTVDELSKRLKELEIENTKLRAADSERELSVSSEPSAATRLFKKIRYHIPA